MGRLHGRVLISTRGGTALRTALKVHTHFARMLLKSQRKIDDRADEEQPKNASHDPGFWHIVYSTRVVGQVTSVSATIPLAG